jgi:ribosomal protein L1
MKAAEVYQEKVDQLYALIGHAYMQKKQIVEQIEDLELQLKSVVINQPLLTKVESAFTDEDK